jgi:hypothetical protein
MVLNLFDTSEGRSEIPGQFLRYGAGEGRIRSIEPIV